MGLASTRKRRASSATTPRAKSPSEWGGQTIKPDTGDTPMRVLGSKVSFRGTTPQLEAEMNSRARAAFARNQQVLTAPHPPNPASNYTRASCASRPYTAAKHGHRTTHSCALQTPNNSANSEASMMGGGRRPGEAWPEWNTISNRSPRQGTTVANQSTKSKRRGNPVCSRYLRYFMLQC